MNTRYIYKKHLFINLLSTYRTNKIASVAKTPQPYLYDRASFLLILEL